MKKLKENDGVFRRIKIAYRAANKWVLERKEKAKILKQQRNQVTRGARHILIKRKQTNASNIYSACRVFFFTCT